jgi:hypothetical protein
MRNTFGSKKIRKSNKPKMNLIPINELLKNFYILYFFNAYIHIIKMGGYTFFFFKIPFHS